MNGGVGVIFETHLTDSLALPVAPDVIPQRVHPLEKSPWEEHLGTLSAAPSQPLLVLSDLSANFHALIHAAETRGFAHIDIDSDKTLKVRATNLGREGKIVLAGDTNDRGVDLIETYAVVNALRKAGVSVECVWGNHELCLVSALIHQPPVDLPIEELGFQRNGKGEPLKFEKLSPDNWAAQIEHWVSVLGGNETLEGLVRYAPKDISYEDLTFGGKADALLREYDLYEEFIRARATLLQNRHARESLNRLKPYVQDDELVIVHSALPQISDKYDSHVELRREMRSHLIDPSLCWLMSFGFEHRNADYKDHSDESQEIHDQGISTYRGLIGDSVWARLPAFSAYCVSEGQFSDRDPFSDLSLLKIQQQFGTTSILRGHDSPKHLAASGQSFMQLNGVEIVNCEVELSEDEARGYTYVSTEGEIFSYTNQSYRPEDYIPIDFFRIE